MQIRFIFIFALLISQFSLASNCRAVKWPFSPKIANLEAKHVEKVPRRYLYDYLYFEISNPVNYRVPGLAKKLFFILENTEVNEDKYQMLQGFEWAADLDLGKPRVISISEICAIEDKITRAPSSSKKSKVRKASPGK